MVWYDMVFPGFRVIGKKRSGKIRGGQDVSALYCLDRKNAKGTTPLILASAATRPKDQPPRPVAFNGRV